MHPMPDHVAWRRTPHDPKLPTALDANDAALASVHAARDAIAQALQTVRLRGRAVGLGAPPAAVISGITIVAPSRQSSGFVFFLGRFVREHLDPSGRLVVQDLLS